MASKKLLPILLLTLISQSLQAITTTFDDKTKFNILTGPSTLNDTYPSVNWGTLDFESDFITLQSASGSGFNFDEWTTTFPGNDLALNGVESFDIKLAAPLSSFGFDIEDSNGPSEFRIQLFRNGGLVNTTTLNTNSNTIFFGIWSDVTFDEVKIREQAASGSNEYFGNFYGSVRKNRDLSSNFDALICQFPLLFAYSFSTTASIVAPTPTDTGFSLAAYSANLALKYCKAWGDAPGDIITTVDNPHNPDENSFEACYKTFDHERVHSGFTSLFSVPVQYDNDWGELGTPQVIHQNSDVEVYMMRGLQPPITDTLSLSSLLGDELAAGGIYSDCDDIKEISDTGHLCPYAEGRTLSYPVGRNTQGYRFDVNMGILDLVYISVPKFPQGTKNKAMLDLAAELLAEVAQVVWDLALGGWRFGNYVDRYQQVIVHDTTIPSIDKASGDFNDDGVVNAADLLFIDNVVIEADEIGGVSANRFQSFLRSMYDVSDACNRSAGFLPIYPNDDLRVFWPVNTTNTNNAFDLTWEAKDAGPNLAGLPNINSVMQNISVVDTRPPIIQPPMDIVELTSDTQVTLDLGQPLVFDLVDLNPIIMNDAAFPLSPGLHTITWTATDASGNQASTTQSVNIKNSNIEPNANDLIGANRPQAISFDPLEITLTGFDPDSDPLNFFIEDYPDDGFFVSPLYPYFIEDYRLEAAIDDDALAQQCIDQGNTTPFHVQAIRNPVYFSVLDDGSTYVIDYGYVECRQDVGQPPRFEPRIAKFDSAGNYFTAQNRDLPDDLYINQNTSTIYTTTGAQSQGTINELDLNLNTIFRYELFSMPDQDPNSGNSYNIPYARSAVIDSQGILYVMDNLGDIHAMRTDRGNGTGAGNDPLRPAYLGLALQTPFQGLDYDLAIDSNDQIYASIANRIYKLTAATLNSDGDYELGNLIGWAGKCDEDTAPGDQAVCDVANQRSLGYSCTDEYCGGSISLSGDQPGQFNRPQGIAIDPNDVLYVTDYDNFRIQRFTPDGFFAGQAESACEGNCFVLGDFGRPEDIAVNSTHFFIIDPDTDLLHISQTSPFLEIGDDYAVLEYQSNNDFACVLSADCIDSFSFSVSDGVRDSDSMQMIRSTPAQVDIEVARNFRAPFATPGIEVLVAEDEASVITLDGSDPDPLDNLIFAISTQPFHGSVQLLGNQATYIPDLNYVGDDSFAFTVNDGNETSAPETVMINVYDVNDPAIVIFDNPLTVARGFELQIEGVMSDPDPIDNHKLLLKWNDGSPNEPQGDINMMGEITGPLLLTSSSGNGQVIAKHVFNATGTVISEACVTDRLDQNNNPTAESIESCSPAVLNVVDMVDLTFDVSGPEVLIRGQSDNYTITITNRAPDSGIGMTATNIEFTAQMDDVLITAAPSGCSENSNFITCDLNSLNSGESIDVVIPFIVPSDAATQISVTSELDLLVDQLDLTETNKLIINTPMVFPADIIIGGQGTDELVDNPELSSGDGICAGLDTGACNIRAAIMEANANVSNNSIALGNAVFGLSFDDTKFGELAIGDLDVLSDLLIIGNGPEQTFIDAAGIDRVFDIHSGATLELNNLSIVGGLTNDHGAGILIQNNAKLILNNVRIFNNDSTGLGGGISNFSQLNDSLLIENSTISSNTADSGAGIYSTGGGLIRNSTISTNQSTDNTGGILQLTQNLLLNHVTIAGNSGPNTGGLSSYNSAIITIQNSILVNNSPNDCFSSSGFGGTGGSISSDGGNVINNISICDINQNSNDLFNQNTDVSELRNYGGLTETHALSISNPARDQALAINCPTIDQRGELRPTDGDGDGVA
ncbi:MAG: Ig-like domain-containing protein, partial [Marinicella sp.]